jgi:hypothetical protein
MIFWSENVGLEGKKMQQQWSKQARRRVNGLSHLLPGFLLPEWEIVHLQLHSFNGKVLSRLRQVPYMVPKTSVQYR